MEIYTSNNHPKVSSQMQVFALKGHERPITSVKYNADGDLLFSASKDAAPSVWYSETGERLGTYGYHKGAVWDIDPSWDSKYLLTAGGDGSARLFEVTSGKYLIRMPHRGAVRAVAWSEGSYVFATASDPFTSNDPSMISVFDFPSPKDFELSADSKDVVPTYAPRFDIILDYANKVTSLGWTYGNEFIIAGFDNGMVCLFDPITGRTVVERKDIHTARVNQLRFNKDKTLVITASKDFTAKVLDPRTLDIIKVFQVDRPVNGAVISPNMPHVIIGGGQDAQSVTTTSASQGKFDSKFFHLMYGDEFGRIKGHFGPINAMAIHPLGESFASGSEDGYVRLHHFDKAYLSMPSYLPADLSL